MDYHSRVPVACIEIHWGHDAPLRTARQCQPGTQLVILPLSDGCQLRGPTHAATPASVCMTAPIPVSAAPGLWRHVHCSSEDDVYLVAYTPKGFNKLHREARPALADSGFTCLPGSQREFWSLDRPKALLKRHHVMPRRASFRVAACPDVPVPTAWLSTVFYEDRLFRNGNGQAGLAWCHAPSAPDLPSAWTGVTTFQVHWPLPPPQVLGGDTLRKSAAGATGSAAGATGATGLQATQQVQAAGATGLQATPQVQAAGVTGLQAMFQATPQVQAAGAAGFQATPQVQAAGAAGFQATLQIQPAASAAGLQATPQVQAAGATGLQAMFQATPQVQAAGAAGFQATPQVQAAGAAGFQATPQVQAASAAGLQATPQVQAAGATGLQAMFQAMPQVQAASAAGLQAMPQVQAAGAAGFQATPQVQQAAGAAGFQAMPQVQAAGAAGFQATPQVQAAGAAGFQATLQMQQAAGTTGLQAGAAGLEAMHQVQAGPGNTPVEQDTRGTNLPKQSHCESVLAHRSMEEDSSADVLAQLHAADPTVPSHTDHDAADTFNTQPHNNSAVEPSCDELNTASISNSPSVVSHPNPFVSQPLAVPTQSADSMQQHECPGDPLYEWYSSPEADWDACPFLAPKIANSLVACHPDEFQDSNVSFTLESISWKGEIQLVHSLNEGLDRHRVLAQILEDEECQSNSDLLGDVASMQQHRLASLCGLEASNRKIQEALEDHQVHAGSQSMPCTTKLRSLFVPCPEQKFLGHGLMSLSPFEDVPSAEAIRERCTEEEFLQTKTIPNEVVRMELKKWTPSIQDEYDSLTKVSKAVRPLTDEQFEELVRDPSVQCELVPGRAIFTVKAHTGRLKTRAVACGNHQTSNARSREDKFASGISAEATRMLIRFAGLYNLRIGVLDIKTAFLNAPVVTPNQEIVIVRVPAIMRASGVRSEKYWVVDKALYGLDVAPRSWCLHRNKVISGITSLEGTSRQVRCLPMEEDANVWVVVDCVSDTIIAYLALYVDDILILGEHQDVEEVAQTLEGLWTTTPVMWAEPTSVLSFDGFEVEKCEDGYRVHQKSYLKELLKQYASLDGISNIPCPKEIIVTERQESQSESVKLAQCLTGQLLWLSGRTRPDISYAVSAMGQAIVHNPEEAIARGYHLIKFLRQSPEVSLEYGAAPDRFGQWGQLKWRQTSGAIDVFSDASFMVDSESRSVGSAQLYWGGAIVMWHCGKQPLLSASTAESELIAMAEGFTMGRSLRPFVEALCAHRKVTCRASIYTDNSAA